MMVLLFCHAFDLHISALSKSRWTTKIKSCCQKICSRWRKDRENSFSKIYLNLFTSWQLVFHVFIKSTNKLQVNPYLAIPGLNEWLIDWMVFYATFQQYSVISRRQLTLFVSFLGFTSTRLGLWSVLPKDTPTKNPGDQILVLTIQTEKPFGIIVGKGKMRVTGSFSLFHILNPIKGKPEHFSGIYLVVCKCSQFGLVQNFVICERVKYG